MKILINFALDPLQDKHYLCVMASDTPDQNLSQYFSVCNDFIHAARLREGNVLIHCLAGMSRSVTVAVAYIMTATHLNWKEALKVVRAGRAVANPNTGFQTQLQEFEQFKLPEERRRLRERFPSSALEQLDRLKVATALDNYQELLQNRDICEGNCSRGEKCPTGANVVFVRNGEGEDDGDGKEHASGSVKRSVAYTLSFAAEKWKSNTFNSASKGLQDASLLELSSSSGEDLIPNVRYYDPGGHNKGRFVSNLDPEELAVEGIALAKPSDRKSPKLHKRRQHKSSPKKPLTQ